MQYLAKHKLTQPHQVIQDQAHFNPKLQTKLMAIEDVVTVQEKVEQSDDSVLTPFVLPMLTHQSSIQQMIEPPTNVHLSDVVSSVALPYNHQKSQSLSSLVSVSKINSLQDLQSNLLASQQHKLKMFHNQKSVLEFPNKYKQSHLTKILGSKSRKLKQVHQFCQQIDEEFTDKRRNKLIRDYVHKNVLTARTEQFKLIE